MMILRILDHVIITYWGPYSTQVLQRQVEATADAVAVRGAGLVYGLVPSKLLHPKRSVEKGLQARKKAKTGSIWPQEAPIARTSPPTPP